MSTIGFAARPGTDVEPTWSIRRAAAPSAPRMRCGFLFERRRPRRVVLGDRVAAAPTRPAARRGLAIRRRRASSASASKSDCWAGSLSAVSSGCHCTPTIQGCASCSGRSSSIASTNPSEDRPVATRPSPTRSTPWWWCEEATRFEDFVVANRRLRGSTATSCSDCVSRTGTPCSSIPSRSGRCGWSVPPNATFMTCMPRQMQRVGMPVRTASCSSPISIASRSGSTP